MEERSATMKFGSWWFWETTGFKILEVEMKKAGGGGKTQIGSVGKNAKVGSSFPTGGRLLSVSTGKTSTGPSFKTAKPHKSSTSFGVIWIPRRKINKYHTDKVYNSNKNVHPSNRAPSMYNYGRSAELGVNGGGGGSQVKFGGRGSGRLAGGEGDGIDEGEDSMSAESSHHEPLKNKDDESALLAPEHSGNKAWVSAGAVAAASELPVPAPVGGGSEEKRDLFNGDKDDDQEAAGDKDNKSKESEPHMEKDRDKEEKSEKEKGDNVDSVFLRSPPAHKRAASASPPQEEDCGIKCLYYTLQCCDCVLM